MYNVGGDNVNSLLATFLVQVYRFLYKPSDIAKIFNDYNSYVNVLYQQNWFSTMCSAMSILGVGLLTVGFLVSLGDKASAGDFTLHNFFVHFLKFFMLYVILMNISTIFQLMLDFTSAVFNDMNKELTGSIIANEIKGVDKDKLQNGLAAFGLTSRVGMLMSIVVPYFVSVVFYSILYFFATSRIMELVIRISAAPLVAGVSFFGKGANTDIVRYIKRSMGIMFQIVVILVISASVTFIHNSIIVDGRISNSTSGKVENPATYLEHTTTGKREIEIRSLNVDMETDENGKVTKINKVTETGRKDEEVKSQEEQTGTLVNMKEAYPKSDIEKFVNSLTTPSNLFTGVGIMLAALFMLFKSREISMRMFN